MAQVTKVTARFGMSVELRQVWYKYETEIEVALDADDDAKEVREKAWNTVKLEIEKQVQATIKELGE